MKDNKRPMGRGLSAILNTEFKNNVTKTEETKDIVGNIVDIPLEKIIPNKSQPRNYFGDQALSELAQSIESLGIIQPITVKKQDDKFLIISGERRFRASKIVGLKTIPAYVRLADDKELLEMALVENIQREDLNAIEIALTYQRFLEELEMTQEQLSQRIGKERSTITNAIRLLKLPPVIQDAIRNGIISAGHGRAILSLDDEKLQFELLAMIIKEKLNVRQAELLANSLKNPKQKKETQQKENIPNHYKKVQKNLSDLLDLKVEIKTASNGKKGKLILDFKNEKELENILTYFNQSFEFLMKKVICILFCLSMCFSFSQNVEKDSLSSTQIIEQNIQKLNKIQFEKPNNPKKAGIYSAILPGLGQIYNKKYWKLPIVWGGIGTGVGIIAWNQRRYTRYRSTFNAELNAQKH